MRSFARRRPLATLPLLLGIGLLAGCTQTDGGFQADPAPPVDGAAQSVVVATPSPSPTSHLRVVTVGDSLMSGYGLTRSSAWPALLAKSAHFSVVNLACGGMGFVVSGDCGTPYSGLVPAVIALEPNLVIIESSSNDFGEPAELLDQDTLATMTQLRTALPDVPIVALSTIWNDEQDIPDEIAATSSLLENAAAATGAIYVDIGQPLAGHPEWMQADDIHPTTSGQRAIAAAIGERLSAIGLFPPAAS